MSVVYSLHLWDIVDGNGTVLYTSEPYIGWFFPTRVAFSPDGALLVFRTQHSDLVWGEWQNLGGPILPTASDRWKKATGSELPAIPNTQVCVTHSPDGALMAVENYIREEDSGKTHILDTGSDPPACVAFSRDGRFLAIAAKNGIVQLWGVKP
jgi:WD40 repeat protein